MFSHNLDLKYHKSDKLLIFFLTWLYDKIIKTFIINFILNGGREERNIDMKI